MQVRAVLNTICAPQNNHFKSDNCKCNNKDEDNNNNNKGNNDIDTYNSNKNTDNSIKDRGAIISLVTDTSATLFVLCCKN